MFKPLLASPVALDKLEYPVLVSPKYDGFRCVINQMQQPMSRNLKPIPNDFIFAKIQELNLPPFDGELLTFTNGKPDDFNIVQSKLTNRSGRPEFTYMIFDDWGSPRTPFIDRLLTVSQWLVSTTDTNVLKYCKPVRHELIHDQVELLDYEAKCIEDGWEGAMIRSVNGIYKFGRSTMNEGILLKMKRFFDDEAVIVSCTELVHNSNEATTDNLGQTVRSSHQSGMVGRDTLGKFTVKWGDVEFDIGTGFDARQRAEYWADRNNLVGRVIKFKYQSVGPNRKPRFPVFLGFRPSGDLDSDIPF